MKLGINVENISTYGGKSGFDEESIEIFKGIEIKNLNAFFDFLTYSEAVGDLSRQIKTYVGMKDWKKDYLGSQGEEDRQKEVYFLNNFSVKINVDVTLSKILVIKLDVHTTPIFFCLTHAQIQFILNRLKNTMKVNDDDRLT